MAQPTSEHDGSGICRTAAQIEQGFRQPLSELELSMNVESCDQHFVLGAQSGERNAFNAFAPKCRHRFMKLSMRLHAIARKPKMRCKIRSAKTVLSLHERDARIFGPDTRNDVSTER
jgi:hypothetical protein